MRREAGLHREAAGAYWGTRESEGAQIHEPIYSLAHFFDMERTGME
jgi:hypothetical protein